LGNQNAEKSIRSNSTQADLTRMPPNKAQIKKKEKQIQERSDPNAQSDSDVHVFLSYPVKQKLKQGSQQGTTKRKEMVPAENPHPTLRNHETKNPTNKTKSTMI